MQKNFVSSEMGTDETIVKELKEEKSDADAPQFLINWDEENYDIPAFLRHKAK